MITYELCNNAQEIMYLLFKFKEEGTLSDLFYGDKEVDISAVTTHLFCDPKTLTFIGKINGIPAGLVFLDTLKYKTAYLHMCILSKYWDKSVEAGKLFLEATAPTFNLIIGIYPKALTHMGNYAKKIGMQYKCDLEDYIYNENTGLYEGAELWTIHTDKGV
jgi:hypothetical protein